MPPATNPPRPVLKSKQTETPLPHVNSTSTNNKLHRLSTPPPSLMPQIPFLVANTPLVLGYSIITPFPPPNALARIFKYMHSHTASAHCVRLVPAVPPSCPEGQAEEKRETVCVKMTFMLLWCLLHNPTWHLYNLLQGYTLHPLHKSCN